MRSLAGARMKWPTEGALAAVWMKCSHSALLLIDHWDRCFLARLGTPAGVNCQGLCSGEMVAPQQHCCRRWNYFCVLQALAGILASATAEQACGKMPHTQLHAGCEVVGHPFGSGCWLRSTEDLKCLAPGQAKKFPSVITSGTSQ